MNKEDFIKGMFALATTLLMMIILSPLLLLTHNGGNNGPDIWNFIGLAYLAVLVLASRKIKWRD